VLKNIAHYLPLGCRAAINMFLDEWRLERLPHHYSPTLNELIGSLPFSRKGTYLDIGAFDGRSSSNTWHLEKRLDWGGVLIEPVPQFYRKMMQTRSPERNIFINCAVGGNKIQEREMIMYVADSMSIGELSSRNIRAHLESASRIGINTEQKIIVPLRPTVEVLDEFNSPKSFDFCSVDIEGSEYDVVVDLLNSNYLIKYFLVETECNSETEKILSEFNYIFVGRDNGGGNSLWLRN